MFQNTDTVFRLAEARPTPTIVSQAYKVNHAIELGYTKAYGRITPEQYREQAANYFNQDPSTAGCFAKLKQIPVPSSVNDAIV